MYISAPRMVLSTHVVLPKVVKEWITRFSLLSEVIHQRPHRRRPQLRHRPCTSIGDGSTITNSEIQNSIVMEGALIECGELITDSIIGRNAVIRKNNELPKGKRFIIGDQSKVII